MGKVLETQKIVMSDETKIAKEFRVSLFMEGTEQVVNTNLKKKYICNKMCTQYFLKKEIIQ